MPVRDFAERLRVANTRLLVSGLLFIEAPQCWRRLYRRGLLVPSQRGIDLISDRLNAFAEANRALQTFLAAFNISQIRATVRIIATASRLVATFELSSHDAVVLAIAEDTKISDIAATDRDFRKADNIELWDGLFP